MVARSKKTPFQYWESNNNSGIESRYIRIGSSQMNHRTYRALVKKNGNAAILYHFMRMKAGGKRDFEFPHTEYKDLMAKGTFTACKNLLIRYGFIEEIENNAHRMTANVYRFSDKWKTVDLSRL